MYETFFGLRQTPFDPAHNMHFHVQSATSDAALHALTGAVERRDSVIWISGAPGIGKTMLLRAYQRSFDPKRVWALFFMSGHLDRHSLLAALDEAAAQPDPILATAVVQAMLTERSAHGQNVVLVIDDANHLDDDTWETLGALARLEGISIVLTSRLAANPRGHSLAMDLASRPSTPIELSNLTSADARIFLEERVRRAGGKPEKVLSRSALDMIIERAAGNPRRLLLLAGSALNEAFKARRRPVSNVDIDLGGRANTNRSPATYRGVWGWGIAVTALFAITFAVVRTDLSRTQPQPQPRPLQQIAATPTAPPQASQTVPYPPADRMKTVPPSPAAPIQPDLVPSSRPATNALGDTVHAEPHVIDVADVIAIPARSGDTLLKLYASLYRSARRPDFAAVIAVNPGIHPSAALKAGQVVVFPAADAQ